MFSLQPFTLDAVVFPCFPVVPFTFPLQSVGTLRQRGGSRAAPPSLVALLCSRASCLACPCHEKMHHVTAGSPWHMNSSGMPRLWSLSLRLPRLPSFPLWLLMSLLGWVWGLWDHREGQWSWEHPHTTPGRHLQPHPAAEGFRVSSFP